MKICLLRHGRTEANDRSLYCGSTDLGLSDAGRAALEALRQKGGYPDLEGLCVYTSGMKRAEETLAVFYGDVPHGVIADLREMDFGVFEMHSYEELREREDYCAWCDGDNESNVAPEGESGRMMQQRVWEAFSALVSEGKDALVVSHGGPIAHIMGCLFPDEGKNRFDWQPKNGKGYCITVNGDEKSYSVIPTEG